MKKLLVVLCVLLSACMADDMANGPDKTLSTAADFAPLFGKRLAFSDADFVTINANGTLSGEFGGEDTLGTWELRDGYWCRVLTAGPRGPQPEDCQLFVQKGNVLSITRDRGNGNSFDYTIT